MSVEKAVALIKRIINRYGISEFNFVDDSIPPVFLKKFSEKLLEENLKIRWRCVSCLDRNFLKDDTPSLMRKAGLALMDKMQRSDIVSEIIKKFDQAGITSEELDSVVKFAGKTLKRQL